jgi:hypothetical protein
MMTPLQTSLVEAIRAKREIIRASFKDGLLVCEATVIKVGGKKQMQKFAFAFDDVEACMGARLIHSSVKGTYAHHYADDVFSAYLEWDEITSKMLSV